MTPPRPYASWWATTEACSERQGRFDDVEWYVVPDAKSFSVRGKDYNGVWYESNAIVIAGGSLLDGKLVRHEMLHALNRGDGHSKDFVTRCGGIVACVNDCAAEAGEPDMPAATAPEIPTSGLELVLGVSPGDPSVARDSGWVVIQVSVRNNTTADAWARLAPMADAFASETFGYFVECVPSCGREFLSRYDFIWDSRFGLPARAVRRAAFDVRLPAGTYAIRGTFNTDTTSAVTVVVRP